MQGDIILKGRWRLTKKIGQGAFGETYLGEDLQTKQQVAVKLESCTGQKQVLKLEVSILKKLQDCSYVCRFYNCGRTTEYNYLVMELLGENISELRRRQPANRFSVSTAMRLGIQMLQAIEAMHIHGYLHRDVKPSNFAMGLGPFKHKCYVLDFGLSRRFLLPDGNIRPPREQAGFRGTSRYASLNSHDSQELSRRDDLWSFFYMMMEFITGGLPWRRLKDKNQIGEMKRHCHTPELVRGLPTEFLVMFNYLESLTYEDIPNYRMLEQLMLDLYNREGYPPEVPYDWEQSTQSSRSAAESRSPRNASNDNQSQKSDFDIAVIDDFDEGNPDLEYDPQRKMSISSVQQSTSISPRYVSSRHYPKHLEAPGPEDKSPSVSPPGFANDKKLSTFARFRKTNSRDGLGGLDGASSAGTSQNIVSDQYHQRGLYGSEQHFDSLPDNTTDIHGLSHSRDGLQAGVKSDTTRTGFLPSFQQNSQDPRLVGIVEGLQPSSESGPQPNAGTGTSPHSPAQSPAHKYQQGTKSTPDSPALPAEQPSKRCSKCCCVVS